EPDGQSQIAESDYTVDEPGVYTIYVYASAFDNDNCIDETHFKLTINPLKVLHIDDTVICYDNDSGDVIQTAYIESGVDPSMYTVEWYLDDELVHTGPDFESDTPGEYTVITTKIGPNDGTDCPYAPATFRIRKSSQPIARAYTS